MSFRVKKKKAAITCGFLWQIRESNPSPHVGYILVKDLYSFLLAQKSAGKKGLIQNQNNYKMDDHMK